MPSDTEDVTAHKVDRLADWILQTPGAVNAGRVMGTDDVLPALRAIRSECVHRIG